MTKLKSEILKFLFFAIPVLSAPYFLDGNYLMNVLVFMGINTMLAIALNLLLGYAGQISLGHAGFFGLGAYISGVATATYSIDPWIAMIGAAIFVSAISFLLGFPILKLKGHYLAMATLGLGIIFYIVFNETVDITGGPSGFSGIPNLEAFGITFDSDFKNYYLIWGFVVITVILSLNLTNSRIGRALRSIHDSEIAARVMGVNSRLLKVQIFAISAGICSIAGSLYAHTMTFIAPPSFGFNFSVELLTMVVIGGLGSIYGSFLGASLLTLLPEILREAKDYDIIVFGAILMLMMIFMPGGLVKGLPDILGRFIPKRGGEK